MFLTHASVEEQREEGVEVDQAQVMVNVAKALAAGEAQRQVVVEQEVIVFRMRLLNYD